MFYLEEFAEIKNDIDSTISEDISEIIKRMLYEKIDLVDWKLIEIPSKKVYCFYNSKKNQAFDYELDSQGNMMPHYYKNKENTMITKYSSKSIKQAMMEYSLLH